MKSEFRLQSKEAEEGLLSLRSDAVKVAGWLKERHIKRKMGGKRRPVGLAPTKKFDGKIYVFHSWYDNLPEAREMCFAIRRSNLSQFCKIDKVDDFYIVYKRKNSRR